MVTPRNLSVKIIRSAAKISSLFSSRGKIKDRNGFKGVANRMSKTVVLLY